MKTIQLTPLQRKDISERRRQAQDRRIFQRLSAALWSDDGRSGEEIAQLVGVSTRQVGQWFRIFRNKGLDELGTLHSQGDPGRLGPAQVKRPRQEIEAGCSTTPTRSVPGSRRASAWPTRPRASRICSAGSGQAI